MRRTEIVCAFVAVSWAIAATSLPRNWESRANAAPANPGASAAASPLPRVIATGVTARALAVNPSSAIADSASETGPATLYLTAVEKPDQLLAIPAADGAIGRQMAAIAGSGAGGSLGDGGPALRAQFDLKTDSLMERSGVVVASDETIFVADTRNSTIRRIAGALSSEIGIVRSIAGRWGPPQVIALVEPLGLALDRAGDLYIADRGANALLVLRSASSTVPQPLEILAHVAAPASIAASADGSRIFAASPETGKIFAITPATHSIEEIENRASVDAPVTPAGLAVDGGGNLFVADSAGNQILRRDASSGAVSIAAGNIHSPGEIAFDAKGNLFVSEQGLSRVLELEHLGIPASSVTITPPAPLPPPAPPLTCPPSPNSPTAYNFCTEPQGGTTPSQSFLLTNSTGSALTGLTIGFNPATTPSDFQILSSSCTQTLNANSSCTINVAFSPTASGERDSLLSVSFTGAANPVTSPLAGTGDDYQIAFQSSQSSTVTVVNGSAAKYQMQINPDSLFGGPVQFICPSNMPAHTTCSITPANPVPVTPSTSAMFTAVFQTTSRNPGAPAPSGGAVMNSLSGCSRRIALLGFPALLAAVLAYLWILPKRRGQVWLNRHRAIRYSVALALFGAIGAIAAGCGHHGTTIIAGTPAGTTVMILQGTAQGATRGITVTLVVQ